LEHQIDIGVQDRVVIAAVVDRRKTLHVDHLGAAKVGRVIAIRSDVVLIGRAEGHRRTSKRQHSGRE
jgi:hypothetical protein